MPDIREIQVSVNGEDHSAKVETRTSLGDFLRQN